MLSGICTRNFALIDRAELELEPGLTVLTGETGAGKSILIDSVTATLGGRLRGDVIGANADCAFTELVFAIDDEKAAQLSELGIRTEDDILICSRRICEGHSIYKLGGETVSASLMRRVTGLLIDIYGQHEHESLLHSGAHLDILDDYLGDDQEKEAVLTRYNAYLDAQKAYEAYSLDRTALQREIDLLRFEISEIESAKLFPGERAELEDEFRRLTNSEKLCRAAGKAGSCLCGEGAALDMISAALHELSQAAVYDGTLKDRLERLTALEDDTHELGRELEGYAERMEYDPQRLRDVSERLDVLGRLEQKYGRGYDAVMAALDERIDRLAALEDYDDCKARAKSELDKAYAELEAAAKQLTQLRQTAIRPFTREVIKALSDMNFADVRFDVQLVPTDTIGPGGADEADFLVALNPGLPLQPLSQVASGGELSRIMLGMKAVLAGSDKVPTLIFDEIDSGISGRTADMVGRKLRVIAKHRQVMCITHLPQIAAMADSHFVIEKEIGTAGARTRIRKLDDDGRVHEIARLLGGASESRAALEAAAELIREAKG